MKSTALNTVKIFALSAVILGLTSCSKLAKNVQYDLDMQTATVNVDIPPLQNTNVSFTGTQTNFYNIDSFIKASTMGLFGIDNITSVKLEGCNLQLKNPSLTENFANFNAFTGSFYSNSVTTPVEIDVLNNPDTYAASLSMPVDTSTNLKSYVNNASQFSYSLGGKLRRSTKDTLHCVATFTFKVHVQGL